MCNLPIKLTIEKAIKACREKDVLNFVNCFTDDAYLILSNNDKIFKSEIMAITENYFSELEFIKIDINALIFDQNLGFIEWTWQDFNYVKKQSHCRNNVIVLEFQSNLISSWREYSK